MFLAYKDADHRLYWEGRPDDSVNLCLNAAEVPEVTRRAPNMLVPRGKLQEKVILALIGVEVSTLITTKSNSVSSMLSRVATRSIIYQRDALTLSLFEPDRYSAGKRHK